MPDYRVYLVGRDGHFANVDIIESNADQEAIERAEQIASGRHVELWQGSRRVATLNDDKAQSKE
jgi:hypothetical protein